MTRAWAARVGFPWISKPVWSLLIASGWLMVLGVVLFSLNILARVFFREKVHA